MDAAREVRCMRVVATASLRSGVLRCCNEAMLARWVGEQLSSLEAEHGGVCAWASAWVLCYVMLCYGPQ